MTIAERIAHDVMIADEAGFSREQTARAGARSALLIAKERIVGLSDDKPDGLYEAGYNVGNAHAQRRIDDLLAELSDGNPASPEVSVSTVGAQRPNTDVHIVADSAQGQEREQKKDHSAELAAVGNDTGLSPTETASRIQYDDVVEQIQMALSRSSDDGLWALHEWLGERSWNMHRDCSKRVCKLIGLMDLAFAENDYDEVRSDPNFLRRRVLQFFVESLAAPSRATEVSSAPAASPALKENPQT